MMHCELLIVTGLPKINEVEGTLLLSPFNDRTLESGLKMRKHEFTLEGVVCPGGGFPIAAQRVCKSPYPFGLEAVQVNCWLIPVPFVGEAGYNVGSASIHAWKVVPAVPAVAWKLGASSIHRPEIKLTLALPLTT